MVLRRAAEAAAAATFDGVRVVRELVCECACA